MTKNIDASVLGIEAVQESVIFEGLEYRYVRTQLGIDGQVTYWVYEYFGHYLWIWNDKPC